MEDRKQKIMQKYIDEIKNIYGEHLRKIILYGSYARGDHNSDSDIDIMILLDLKDMDIKKYRHKLSDMTFDVNLDNDVDIKPMAINEAHFDIWVKNYPFYKNIKNDGVILYGAA